MPSAESRVSAFYCRVHVSAYHFSQLCPETMQKPGLHDEPKSLFPSVYTQTDGINTTSLAVKKKPKKTPRPLQSLCHAIFGAFAKKKKEEEKKSRITRLVLFKNSSPEAETIPDWRRTLPALSPVAPSLYLASWTSQAWGLSTQSSHLHFLPASLQVG